MKPTKEQLYDLYWNRKLSTRKIAKICNLGKWKLLKYMREYNIQIRSMEDCLKKYNPMKNPKTAKKMAETKKRLYKEGKLFMPKCPKGVIAWNKGRKEERKEVIEKLSKSHKGKIPWNKGIKYGKNREKTKQRIKRARAKQKIPNKDTSIEIKLQMFLTQLGIEFYTHVYRKEIKHAYRCDIWIPKYNLIIEADGDYWHGNPIKYTEEQLNKRQREQKIRDKIRTKELKEKGFKVLRLWECDIRAMDLDSFKERLDLIRK